MVIKKFEGTDFTVMGPFYEWPPPVCSLIKRVRVEVGSFSLWGTKQGSLVASFCEDNCDSFYIETCAIQQVDVFPSILCISWSNSQGEIIINGKLAGSTDKEKEIPKLLEVGQGKITSTIDLSIENENKVNIRIEEVKGFGAKANRRMVTPPETIRDLEDAKSNLEDSLNKLLEGKHRVASVIASQLRALICRPPNPSSYPLLQRTAGLLELPLTVWANPSKEIPWANPPKEIGDIEPEFWINPAVDLKPTYPSDVAMDLDYWLELPGAGIKEDEYYTNNIALRAIADMRGSHFDPSISPFIDRLREIELGIGGLQSPSTLLTLFLKNVGFVTLGLCDQVIQQSKR